MFSVDASPRGIHVIALIRTNDLTVSNDAGDDDDVSELIEGLEQLVMEEHYEVEIEMNFKWKMQQRQQRLADETSIKHAATIL